MVCVYPSFICYCPHSSLLSIVHNFELMPDSEGGGALLCQSFLLWHHFVFPQFHIVPSSPRSACGSTILFKIFLFSISLPFFGSRWVDEAIPALCFLTFHMSSLKSNTDPGNISFAPSVLFICCFVVVGDEFVSESVKMSRILKLTNINTTLTREGRDRGQTRRNVLHTEVGKNKRRLKWAETGRHATRESYFLKMFKFRLKQIILCIPQRFPVQTAVLFKGILQANQWLVRE